ncbi:MAG TPA: hypothetical protein VNO86_05435 [Candidatus Binatia bacterium]|nr:hypothetical protein [Candidatus Binatia bacterium]
MDDVALYSAAFAGAPARPHHGADPDELRRRLARARARLEAAVPYSPDWDAAMAEIEDLEGVLGELEPEAGCPGRAMTERATTAA